MSQRIKIKPNQKKKWAKNCQNYSLNVKTKDDLNVAHLPNVDATTQWWGKINW